LQANTFDVRSQPKHSSLLYLNPRILEIVRQNNLKAEFVFLEHTYRGSTRGICCL